MFLSAPKHVSPLQIADFLRIGIALMISWGNFLMHAEQFESELNRWTDRERRD